MSGEPGRRWSDMDREGIMSPGERLRRIEEDVAALQRWQFVLVLLFTVDTLLTLGDVVTKVPVILRAFGG